MMKRMVPASAAAALLLVAGPAAAQACLGIPSRDGQIAVAGNFARPRPFCFTQALI